ncbi:MAG TPA: hypothetical protein DCS05_12420 [Nitrospiraceae bacterium]|nr:hypothetical protein [Nitrospiraceae bacterium]
MEYHLLKGVVEELGSILPGARVDRVYEGADRELLIAYRDRRKSRVLLFASAGPFSRIHLVTRKPPAAASLSPFTQYLRSRLPGAKILYAALLGDDRIVEMAFGTADEEYRLIFEVFGSMPTLLLTDRSGRILALSRQRPPDARSMRILLPGLIYEAPAPAGSGKKGSGFVIPVAGAATSGTGQAVVNRDAEVFYERALQDRSREVLGKKLAGTIAAALRKTQRRVSALTGDSERAEQADEYRLAGELIHANLNVIRKGEERVELTGYDGSRRTIVLDGRLSPARNAEQYFKKFKKAKAGLAIIAARLEQSQQELSQLTALDQQLRTAAGDAALRQVNDCLASLRIGSDRARGAGKKGAGKGGGTEPFRRYLLAGWEILVGRSAAGNDYITTKLARPADLWMHAEGMPGSHVLVRNPSDRDVPPEVFSRAAGLAAYYSKGRGAGKVPVTYTFAKYVRKPKGAKPGLVVLSQRATIMAAPAGDEE